MDTQEPIYKCDEMMTIVSILKLCYRSIALARKYPVNLHRRFEIFVDYIKLYKTKGLDPDEYYDFRFDQRSEEFRNTFLGLNEQRYYLDLLNPKKYYILARNKFVAHKMLENTSVRKSNLYAYYQPEGRVLNSEVIANDTLGVYRILKAKSVESCVIKTTESSHDDNVWVIKQISYEENDAWLLRYDNKRIKLSELLNNDPLIFESLVRQTQQLSDFNESSVNTIRFMTALYPNGNAKIIGTFMKIGRSGKCVDNAGAGGNVDVCIDTDTGEIKYAIQFDGWKKIKDIDKHPDNGTQLNGVVIDNWERIKSEVIKFQQAFPYCKVAGWDIAITDQGPLVIEVNDFWDRTGQYFIRKGWRNEIRDCFLAWEKEDRDYSMYRQMNKLSLQHLKKIASHEQI